MLRIVFLVSLLCGASWGDSIEKRLDRMEKEISELKSRSIISLENATFFNFGLGLILPQGSTFSFDTDTGLGLGVGVGHYFGKYHGAELSLLWDFHLAASAKYRFTFRFQNNVVVAPVIGFRTALAQLPPFDKFVTRPELVESSFFLLGAFLGFPIPGTGILSMELLHCAAGQQFLTLVASFHLIL